MRTQNAARRTSIVDSFHEPALRSQILVDSIQRGLFTFPATFRANFRTQRPHLNIPFFARPRGFGPPVAFRCPEAGKCKDSPALSIAAQKRELAVLKFNAGGK